MKNPVIYIIKKLTRRRQSTAAVRAAQPAAQRCKTVGDGAEQGGRWRGKASEMASWRADVANARHPIRPGSRGHLRPCGTFGPAGTFGLRSTCAWDACDGRGRLVTRASSPVAAVPPSSSCPKPPVRSRTVRSRPARSRPVRSQPVRAQPVRSRPVRSRPARARVPLMPPRPALPPRLPLRPPVPLPLPPAWGRIGRGQRESAGCCRKWSLR